MVYYLMNIHLIDGFFFFSFVEECSGGGFLLTFFGGEGLGGFEETRFEGFEGGGVDGVLVFGELVEFVLVAVGEVFDDGGFFGAVGEPLLAVGELVGGFGDVVLELVDAFGQVGLVVLDCLGHGGKLLL